MIRKSKARHVTTGERGERAARFYLRLRGYRILERNYLCPLGEIDIVALKRGVIVFVEVRTRQEGALVDPIVSITDIKLAHIMDAARYFVVQRKTGTAPCRFDIITVSGRGLFNNRISHYIDAFRTSDERPTRGVRLKAWIRHRPRPGGKTRRHGDTENLG